MSIKTFGVDISENNGAVDFTALRRAGVEFALIRCGYGSDDPDQDDKRFFENVQKAKAAGIPYGVYFYSYALNIEEAKSEAAHALRLLAQVDKPVYGVWFDMEDADHYKQKHGMPSNDTLVKICEVFCMELEAHGYYTGIYAAVSWLDDQLNDRRLDKYDKWVAQWNDVCEYRKPYGIWQYTNKLHIDGGRFDGNYAYKDYPALTSKKEEHPDWLKDDDTPPEESNAGGQSQDTPAQKQRKKSSKKKGPASRQNRPLNEVAPHNRESEVVQDGPV